MKSEHLLSMINELDVTDFYSEFDIIFKIYVKKNSKSRDFLWTLELDEDLFDETENSFEISSIALNHNIGFDGERFYIAGNE